MSFASAISIPIFQAAVDPAIAAAYGPYASKWLLAHWHNETFHWRRGETAQVQMSSFRFILFYASIRLYRVLAAAAVVAVVYSAILLRMASQITRISINPTERVAAAVGVPATHDMRQTEK